MRACGTTGLAAWGAITRVGLGFVGVGLASLGTTGCAGAASVRPAEGPEVAVASRSPPAALQPVPEATGPTQDLPMQGPPMQGLRDQAPCREVSERCQRAVKLFAAGRSALEHASLAFGEGGESAARAVQLFEAAEVQVGPSDVLGLETARARLALGDAAPALRVLEELARRYPVEAEVQGALGVALLATGRTEDARVALQQAALLEPESAARHSALGTAQFLLGMMDAAERSYRASLGLSPGSAQVHGDLGSLLVVLGRIDEGRDHLLRATALAPERASFQSNLAYADLTRGELTLALAEAKRALELDPTLVSGWLNLGLIELGRGDWNAAEAAFRRAQDLAPDDPRPAQDLRDLADLRAAESRDEARTGARVSPRSP